MLPAVPLSAFEQARLREVAVRDARRRLTRYSVEARVAWARDPVLVDLLQRALDEPQPGDDWQHILWARNAAIRSIGLDPSTRPVDL